MTFSSNDSHSDDDDISSLSPLSQGLGQNSFNFEIESDVNQNRNFSLDFLLESNKLVDGDFEGDSFTEDLGFFSADYGVKSRQYSMQNHVNLPDTEWSASSASRQQDFYNQSSFEWTDCSKTDIVDTSINADLFCGKTEDCQQPIQVLKIFLKS